MESVVTQCANITFDKVGPKGLYFRVKVIAEYFRQIAAGREARCDDAMMVVKRKILNMLLKEIIEDRMDKKSPKGIIPHAIASRPMSHYCILALEAFFPWTCFLYKRG